MDTTKLSVQVTRPGERAVEGVAPCALGAHVKFSGRGLSGYHTNRWEAACYDAMLVAAAVETCDLSLKRPFRWERRFSVSVPVHDPKLWNQAKVKNALSSALRMLTGDHWTFRFTKTREPFQAPAPERLKSPGHVDAVILFNGSLDALAVSTIMERKRGVRAIPVRVGPEKAPRTQPDGAARLFASLPFKTSRLKGAEMEPSGLSRGFKMAALGGIAARLSGAKRVIMPESGQSALGPSLLGAGHGYADRRAHPQFTTLMSGFFETVFGERIEFEHPALWKTLGQSLAEYSGLVDGDRIWRETRSCEIVKIQRRLGQDNRQCGVCAACMLRRVSLHAAGYNEDPSMYVWGDLSASDPWKASPKSQAGLSSAWRDHAIAGALRMDHLASIPSSFTGAETNRQYLIFERALGPAFSGRAATFDKLLWAHAEEWRSFVNSLPKRSFIRSLAVSASHTHLHSMSGKRIGKRLRIARKNAGVSREDAAAFANLPKADLDAIEKGESLVHIDCLSSLAKFYGGDWVRIVRPTAPHTDFVSRFRKHPLYAESGVRHAVKALALFASAEAELETFLGMERLSNPPPERPLRTGGAQERAEADALELRKRIGLGLDPIHNVFSLLERKLGMRIHAYPLDSKVFGLFAFDDEVGACALLNSDHPYERQVEACARLTGHMITARRSARVSFDGFSHDSPEERHAQAFSRAFLMPAETLSRKLPEALGDDKQLSRRAAITLARHFSVSPKSLVLRLEALGLAQKGTWEWFRRNGGITKAHATEALGRAAMSRPASLYPDSAFLRLANLAGKALEREACSEGLVSEILQIYRVTVRKFGIDEMNRLSYIDELPV